MWEWYEDVEVEGIFFEILELYIFDGFIMMVFLVVVKGMVIYFVSKGFESCLEELICYLNIVIFDLD